MIGIYLDKEGQQQLIAEGTDLSDAEEAVVRSLYLNLEKRLDRLRLPKEEWIDSLSQ